jgi:hypothetical protein
MQRIANGTGDFEKMLPSFGQENQSMITAINEVATDQSTFTLQPNYPNPFRDETSILFSLQEASHVNLQILNLNMQPIEIIESALLSSGSYQYSWNGDGQNPGIYLCVLTVNNKSKMTKMLLIK